MTATSPASSASHAGSGVLDWAAAFREHQPWLRRVLWNRLGDRASVEDVLQEVGLAASRESARPVEPAAFPAWLYRVAVRQAYLHRRKLGRFRKLVTAAGEKGVAPQAATESENPLRWLLVRERQENIQAAFAELGEMDREILILKYMENWTYQQLADRLGVTVHTVEHRLLKAKKSLRRLLAAHRVEDVG